MAMQINNTYNEIYSATGTGGNCSNKSAITVSKESYLNQISKKFPNVNLIEGTYHQGEMFGSKGQCNIMISPVILRKMSSDPEVAAKIEKIIKDIPSEEQIFRAKCNSCGMHVEASGTIVDANGDVSGYCYTTTKREGVSDSSKDNKTEAAKKHTVRQKQKANKELQEASEINFEEKIQEQKLMEQKAVAQYNSSQLYMLNSNEFFEKG